MKLNDLKPAPGAKKSRRRVGRGLGSGRGKTAGRGQKGQKSRSGFSQGSGWEGGRSRLVMRLPKRGFSKLKETYQVVNLSALSSFADGATVDIAALKAAGFVGSNRQPVKILGDGELSAKNLTVNVDAYSKRAVQAIEANGGTAQGYVRSADTSSSQATQGKATEAAPEKAAESSETMPEDEGNA